MRRGVTTDNSQGGIEQRHTLRKRQSKTCRFVGDHTPLEASLVNFRNQFSYTFECMGELGHACFVIGKKFFFEIGM